MAADLSSKTSMMLNIIILTMAHTRWQEGVIMQISCRLKSKLVTSQEKHSSANAKKVQLQHLVQWAQLDHAGIKLQAAGRKYMVQGSKDAFMLWGRIWGCPLESERGEEEWFASTLTLVLTLVLKFLYDCWGQPQLHSVMRIKKFFQCRCMADDWHCLTHEKWEHTSLLVVPCPCCYSNIWYMIVVGIKLALLFYGWHHSPRSVGVLWLRTTHDYDTPMILLADTTTSKPIETCSLKGAKNNCHCCLLLLVIKITCFLLLSLVMRLIDSMKARMITNNIDRIQCNCEHSNNNKPNNHVLFLVVFVWSRQYQIRYDGLRSHKS